MRHNKLLLLLSSLGVLGLLIVAAVQENVLREWRRIQRGASSAAGALDVHLRQVVVPALGVTDRCISCHVGMAAGESALSGGRVLAPHPRLVHEPADFGCTTCHAGQGRATDRADAHGEVAHWPTPMLPRRFAHAGCGACHTHLRVPHLATLRRGRAAFERFDCLACHPLDGRGGLLRPSGGGMEGPDLSYSGARGYKTDWYDDHRARRAAAASGPWRDSFDVLPAEDLEALQVLLDTNIGAPELVEAKAVFHTRGCRGCHKVGGVGGDDGPDLTHAGAKDPGRLDFTHVRGERSVAAWFAEHFRAPGVLVPGSAMPILGLDEREIEFLTYYTLSLRRSNVPEAFWPKDRIRAERFGEREFATDGATLYGSFCSACHGPRGEGMRYPRMPAFPAIGNPDFLALASDEFVSATVTRGRPGRRMPAWGEQEGGLRPAEIAAVVRHVRGFVDGAPPEPDPRPRRWVSADSGAGARLFAMNCALCHGDRGQGGEGVALNNKVLLAAASDTYLVETIKRGRRGTWMQSFATASFVRPAFSDGEIQSIVAFLRTWEEKQP